MPSPISNEHQASHCETFSNSPKTIKIQDVRRTFPNKCKTNVHRNEALKTYKIGIFVIVFRQRNTKVLGRVATAVQHVCPCTLTVNKINVVKSVCCHYFCFFILIIFLVLQNFENKSAHFRTFTEKLHIPGISGRLEGIEFVTTLEERTSLDRFIQTMPPLISSHYSYTDQTSLNMKLMQLSVLPISALSLSKVPCNIFRIATSHAYMSVIL